LRIVFFGTPEIACPTLERLIRSRHELVCVVSQPDRGRGRGRKASPSPVAGAALREGIPLLRPEKVGDADTVEALRVLRPDLGVVVAFGQFLPRSIRELPSKGYLINAHASLLPRHRGANPIAQAILEGDAETPSGISMSVMCQGPGRWSRASARLDAGTLPSPLQRHNHGAASFAVAATASRRCVRSGSGMSAASSLFAAIAIPRTIC
jgi:hypothetical protein